MARTKKTDATKLVNVGVKVPPETKQTLVEESRVTGIAEGTLARNYLLLGMQASRQRQGKFNPVLSQIAEILQPCPPAVQLQALGIIQALTGRSPLALTPHDPSLYPEENAPVEFLVAHEG